MKIIGLTGGVASGKSTVAALLRRQGVEVLNLDEIGREVTDESPGVMAEMQRLCGLQGAFDRRKVREVLFNDETARKKVEQYLHPIILSAFRERVKKAESVGIRIVVCEAALLIESGHYKEMDELIVVMAPIEARINRLVVRDRIPADLAEQMIKAQATDEQRLKLATTIIENKGLVGDLEAQVERLLIRWISDGLVTTPPGPSSS